MRAAESTVPGSLDRDALIGLLDELAGELERRRTRAQIYLIGGAAMSLAFDRRRTTHDVDARIDSGHGELVRAVRDIGRKRGLPESWLNEQATANIPKARDTRARTLYESVYLTITGASAEHILAMKLEASRAHDIQDIATLIDHLELVNENDALAIHRRLFPESRRTERARAALAQALGRATSQREERRTRDEAPAKPQVSALARKIEIARSEIGKGRVEMSIEAGRWWVRYVSTSTPSAARWLGPASDAETVAEAMHRAGEIERADISKVALSLRATASGRNTPTSPQHQAAQAAAANVPTPRKRKEREPDGNTPQRNGPTHSHGE